MDRPGHDFNSRVLCAGGTSSKDDDIEMRDGPASRSLLANIKDDEGDFSPSLPRSPNMNGTDFTKHKVGGQTLVVLVSDRLQVEALGPSSILFVSLFGCFLYQFLVFDCVNCIWTHPH